MKSVRDLGPDGAVLWLAGLSSFAVALVHVVMVPIGTPAYRYFTAPERLIHLSEQGSLIPALVTLGLAAGFTVWGLYGCSGGGMIRRLPLLRTGLAVIGAAYTLRGTLIVPQIAGAYQPSRGLAFSAVSLVVGAAHLIGLARSWRRLRPGRGRGSP